eukprot:symbB.v1.2.015204.t1/scaffold1129.1/size136302/12
MFQWNLMKKKMMKRSFQPPRSRRRKKGKKAVLSSWHVSRSDKSRGLRFCRHERQSAFERLQASFFGSSVCAILAGLVVANNFDVARRPLMERSFADNNYFFRMVFEIGRRYKILNPDKLRGSYGKLIHMLQDSVKGEVVRQLDFDCVGSVKTVWSVVKGNAKALAMLQDPLLTIATKEIYTEGKTRAEAAMFVTQLH